MINRVVILVLDSVGIGELPDADEYGDCGSHTLKNMARAVGGLKLPNLEQLGLGVVDEIPGLESHLFPEGAFGKMAERSKGKDTSTGHWEMMGVWIQEPFPTYPNGFPHGILEPFRQAIGRDILGNFPASGTEIIEQLGEEHL